MSASRAGTPRQDDAGLTLVEIVVALVVLGILAMATLGILLSSQRTSVDARNRVAAANLAAREIDIVREQFLATDEGPLTVANQGLVVNGNPLAGGASGNPLQVDGTAYMVRRSSTWNITGSGTSACEGGSAVEHPTLLIQVEVTWPNMRSTNPVTNQTVLAPERGQGLPSTSSFVAVAVKDSKGEPSGGRTVVVSSNTESRSAFTDSSGCAVVSVNPPAGGADYTARFPDTGYVDISGTTNPERLIGTVTPGQLVSNVQIAIDRAGRAILRATGAGLTDADAAGSTVSLFQSEASGATTITPHTLTGLETTISGLWPTNYGAFFGTDLPTEIANMVTLEPGGTEVIEVEFHYAQFQVTGMPASGDVIAAPVGESCTANSARTVNPSAAELPPGIWDFFLENDDFGCAVGPTAVSLIPGPNSPVVWASSTLRILNAPNEGMPVWAVSGGVTSASCTDAGGKAVQLSTGGGTIGPVELPAGNWYVFAMPESGGQPDGSPCLDAGLVAVPYGQNTSFTWPAHMAAFEVTNIPAISGNQNTWRIIASPSAITASCGTSVPNSPAGIRTIGPSSHRDSSVTGNLPQGTWFVYRQQAANGSGNRCTNMQQVTISWQSSVRLNLLTGAVTTS